MKGWLATRENPLSLRKQRFFYRLQWGFLTQHLTETSAAITQYFVHGAQISIARASFKLSVQLGAIGEAFARQRTANPVLRFVLVADDRRSFQMWNTCLHRARSRDIREWYELSSPLGRGSEGIVLLGINIQTKNTVAVKRIPLEMEAGSETVGERLRRIMREIQLQHKAAKCSSYVAAVVDVFYDDYFCYIVMPHGNKGSLSQLLELRQGDLSESLVRSIAIQLGRCLLALHQNNVVHRDIKCDNVLLQQSQNSPLLVLLCDFGFAAVWRPEYGYSLSSFCHHHLGTPSYIAPEILTHKRYGAPADVFSLGVLCYVCLTGEFPFENENTEEKIKEMEQQELPKLSQSSISPHAKAFCRALLNENARKRLTVAGLLQHRWLRAGQDVTACTRRRVSRYVPGHVVLRRVFHVVTAVLALRKMAIESQQDERLA